ncbi:LacI family DNA-binding transcriptional regulator [Halalkalibacter kiskunsagensis]|uniref:LacI family DNA-binding transcriptional regulator n=1 Tax=Halalkalibacter kiskunsagensis TaxID=1548599 RepID=A0ABV6KHG3_9BACI
MSTMKDVAKIAGVSIITVSRVINSPEKVKESTRKRIQQVMTELGFQPNHTAKALVTNKTRTIHLLHPDVFDTSDPYITKLIGGISCELSENHYSFLFRKDWEFPYKCDGVIAMGLGREEDQLLKDKIDVPCVLFGRTTDIDWVNVDDVSGAYKMVTYMISQGHKEIGMLVLDSKEPFASERLEGYRGALEENGIPFDPNLIQYVSALEKDGYKKTLELLECTDISALFCSTDLLALGAIRAARELNKKVPDELSIGGYDGVWLDQIAEPQLTTIKQPVFEIGKNLARLLIAKIENPNKSVENILYDPELIIRKSISNKNISKHHQN